MGLVSPVSPETWCQTITWNPCELLLPVSLTKHCANECKHCANEVALCTLGLCISLVTASQVRGCNQASSDPRFRNRRDPHSCIHHQTHALPLSKLYSHQKLQSIFVTDGLTTTADGNVYHPVNAQLPNDATNAGLSGQNAGGAGIVPIGTDLGYSQ